MTSPNQFVRRVCRFWCTGRAGGSIGRHQPGHDDDVRDDSDGDAGDNVGDNDDGGGGYDYDACITW